jgi:excinuclease ABC subunit A
MSNDFIHVKGARQNNLKGLDLKLPLNELIVVTGVSGSGKSSLAFDTIYAEGQRRYVETFSPYARQFLDRMDKPRADRIEGIPPAIAIDQTNPVRTSRSTVGTMTELNDHLKLLFARAATLFCRGCGRAVQRDTPSSIADELFARPEPSGTPPVPITFPVQIPENASAEAIKELLAGQGFTRIHHEDEKMVEVIADRVRLSAESRPRIIEALEAALHHGRGRVNVYLSEKNPRRFSSDLHCPDCDIHYRDPLPNLFSFNSPIGACPTCRGFGRVIGIDYGLVIPDETKSLAEGAVRPWQTESNRECQDDLIRFARKRGIPTDTPWRDLTSDQRRWVIEGEGSWRDGKWYGVRRFFTWLESKSYKMHIRVLLSKYRAYNPCPDCEGTRLIPDALLWRLGGERLNIHDVMLLPIDRAIEFFDRLRLPAPLDQAADLLVKEIRVRLRYLVEVGLGYLTLDRQSRTLSGGEVQRINLTTALGTSLVNTLFVLDEPSIGLHPRDIGRLIGILRRLRDAGNSLVVVEHDPQLILAADRVLDLGPGPGEKGGEVVFFGKPEALVRSRRSLTGDYLAGRRAVAPEGRRHGRAPAFLEVFGAAENNLKEIDVRIPLNRLVCVTGVSGSGKSTLVEDVLYRALLKRKGKPVEAPGRHREVRGDEALGDIVLVDQSPIGRTTRSSPASYVGAFDPIRRLFAGAPLSRERGYSASTFSFNTGNGRCPTCGGNGFERIEMQFLSDVYLRCADCDGRRFRSEVLDVKVRGRSISDVLEMTVSEALDLFDPSSEIGELLEPLRAVGLDYLKLGQPVPTLSGGEAQRLKLAGHLTGTYSIGNGSPTLLLFDEPTTGLHFHDIAKLLSAFRRLCDDGHSLVVIEHNLDVIRAADWVIDLGPEGGEAGGRVIFAGTPWEAAKCEAGHTGAALREYESAERGMRSAELNAETVKRETAAPDGSRTAIRIHHAREHNLRGIDVSIPRDRFTVITGVSGSGKSTLAFDILFAEGQRRYLESLNAYARQFVQPSARPDVDAIFGIPPTVAIEQRTSRGGRKSTVATMTEIYHFLRLLFVKLGSQECPDCKLPIEGERPEAILAKLLRDFRGKSLRLLAPLVVARKGYYTDLAKWARARGFSHLEVDGVPTPTGRWPRLDRFKEHDIDLPVGEVRVGAATEGRLREILTRALDLGKGVVKVATAGMIFSTRRSCPRCGRGFPELDPRLFSYNSKHGWCERCYGTGLVLHGFDAEQSGEEIWWNAWWEGEPTLCPSCSGKRLRPEALAVRFQGRSVAELAALPVESAEIYFRTLRLDDREGEIARDILSELRSRLAFLKQVGLGYLSLDRSSPTLSGGEAQRIRLAAQLGSNLRGVAYILDEPTIGLHPRDNRRLLDTLYALRAKGNTVVVVEHDEETIRSAEHLIDLGPGAGRAGGRVVAEGTLRKLTQSVDSITGRMLASPLRHPLVERRPVHRRDPRLEIAGACLNNLKELNVPIPLQRLVCLTGVSGSGKSTLLRGVLHDNLHRLLRARRPGGRQGPSAFFGCTKINGAETLRRVLEVDQTPIGKTPRSCPATYVGFWDEIRRLFVAVPEARMRGYLPGRFSFNVAGGRCEACEGQGSKRIEMSFLPDVTVPCEACGGARFIAEVLAIRYKERSIAEVLSMSVDEATEFFSAHRRIHRALRLLREVGLGYLTLGQPSPTLSGGEAQRIKLVTELAKVEEEGGGRLCTGSHTLYLLDEPTIGLHMSDVEKLVRVLHRLVSAGHSVVMIEHNLDVIAEADWVIDLGPEGGEGGGRIVAEGPPEQIARVRKGSHTAKILAGFLRDRMTSRPTNR